MVNQKKLSNPFSTGGGGVHFEAHVQASFVALMLTGGHAPCLPCWPITEIKLQGKIDGFDTDDLVVVVEDVYSKERRKLHGQVKHSIAITQGSTLFGEVMQAAWNDFKNPKVFAKSKDIIALITGPLSVTDAHNVQWLLNQARHTKNVDEFFRNVQQTNFSPAKSAEKLGVIQHHLEAANGGNDVSRDELYDFLNHFHLLGYDLGNEFGVVLSLLHSHISQFQRQNPQWVWSRIVDIVSTWNQYAGTITLGKLPEDLLGAFTQKAAAEMPMEFKTAQEKPRTDWNQHPDATILALSILIGSWNEKNQPDIEVMSQLLCISYDEWLLKAREILHLPDSPLSLKNGIWKVVNRVELWGLLGSRILDQSLDLFRTLTFQVLKEPDPAFELPTEERYAAGIHGKVLKYSLVLRQGIAEGLAILGSTPELCANCSLGKVEATCVLVIRELLTDANWVTWGSLTGLLPILAEAAPGVFLDAVEKAMVLKPCPFEELYSQESDGITGRNYLTGLLWALEGLAWNDEYLVRTCVALAELAGYDPGGNSGNRPSNSLVTILLPWLPQTLASIEKRIVAVRSIINECPDVAWNLIIQLLPGQQQISSGSYKPRWRKPLPEDYGKDVTDQEYWQQASFYAELAVDAAGQDTNRLCILIDRFDCLPSPAFDKLLQVLSSQPISDLTEQQRLTVWDHLVKFTKKHRRFSDAQWAFPLELIIRIEVVTEQLAPTNPFNLYQPLFADRDFDLYEENGDWEQQQKELDARREAAIMAIFRQDGVQGVIQFAELVSSPRQVGLSLGVIANDQFERVLLPRFLDSAEGKHNSLVSGFVRKCHSLAGWQWCDVLEKSDWTPEQLGKFLSCLPFTKEAWDRASKWLQDHECEYWMRTDAESIQAGSDLAIAIQKLIDHNRPRTAIKCLVTMLRNNQQVDSSQCVRSLLASLSSSEPSYDIDAYNIVELIKFLQVNPSANQDDLFAVEWAYLALLYRRDVDAAPQLLERRLATDPEFFCKVIQLVYRPKNVDYQLNEPTEELMAIAANAWRLLRMWKIPPGTQEDGTFSEERFAEWLHKVKESCATSGHLELALEIIGEVLIYAQSDPDGLWISRAVAAALNDREADDMRRGFWSGKYNSRGVFFVDPTGEPEYELSEQFRSKAEEIENAGFQRFAVTLRDLANEYDRAAKRIIDEHNDRSEA